MKKNLFLFFLLFFCSVLHAGNQGNNLVPEKFRSVGSFNFHGRSATVKVMPGHSYLISLSVKLLQPSSHPECAVRFVIQENGKKGVRSFDWYTVSTEKYTRLSLLYKAPPKVDGIVIVVKPRFFAEDKGTFKDFSAVEIVDDLDE